MLDPAAGTPNGRATASAAPLLALAPPHLALGAAGGSGDGRSSRHHATYCSFSNRGDKLVATYHGDHAYCFDVSGTAPPPNHTRSSTAAATAVSQQQGSRADLFANPLAQSLLAAGAGRNGGTGSTGGTSSMSDLPGMLPAAAERAKADGNLHLFNKRHYEAVHAYSEAIRLATWAPVLYANRCVCVCVLWEEVYVWRRAGWRHATLWNAARLPSQFAGLRCCCAALWRGAEESGNSNETALLLLPLPVAAMRRCLALLQRGWQGDAVFALRDAEAGERQGRARDADGWSAGCSTGGGVAVYCSAPCLCGLYNTSHMTALPACPPAIRPRASMTNPPFTLLTQSRTLSTSLSHSHCLLTPRLPLCMLCVHVCAAVCLDPTSFKAHQRRLQALRAAGLMQVRFACRAAAPWLLLNSCLPPVVITWFCSALHFGFP
jgi:hypothetical protein